MRAVEPAPLRPDPVAWSDSAITLSWLGHSTVLMNFLGLWIITDPVLAARCGLRLGPLTIGPKRYIAPALRVEEIPPLDLILLSHAHMDHLDLWTLRRLGRDCLVVTARETRDLVARLGFREIRELGWGETTTIGELELAACEVRHWGARMQRDDHRGYNGYLLTRAGRRVLFTGDTAMTPAFRQLRGKGPIELMIAPIGAYDPWIRSHCTPEEAVAMADDAGAGRILPVHHSTFRLSREPMEEPLRRFEAAAGDRVAARLIGETLVL